MEATSDKPELRVLIAEDSPDDALLISITLRRSGYRVYEQHISNADALEQALRAEPWDIVLTDHAMPGFSSFDVIRGIREAGLDTPCIIVSGAIGEEVAVSLLRDGAVDYVNKQRLHFLPPAVRRALQGHASERARREAESALQKALADLQVEIEERNRTICALDSAAGALRASEERFRLLIDGTPDYAIFMLDPEGHIITWNTGAERIMGYSSAEVLGEHYALFLPPDKSSRALSERLLEQAIRESAPFEGLCLRKNGSPFWVNATVTPLFNQEDGLRGFSVVTQDVTERKRAADALQAAKEEAERANHAKSQFLSSMSHELRTPLNAIMGFAQLMQLPSLSDKYPEYACDILTAGDHLLELINEMLDIASIEAGRLALVIKPVPLKAVLLECLELIAPLAAKRSIGMQADLEACRSLSLQADRQRLKQVLLNLLSNAVKYNRDGGSVGVTCDVSAERITLKVTDTGSGITMKDQVRLFRDFERLHHQGSDVEGTGIGLALSKRLVMLMNGTIGIESNPGEGSTFWVSLPLAPQEVSPR